MVDNYQFNCCIMEAIPDMSSHCMNIILVTSCDELKETCAQLMDTEHNSGCISRYRCRSGVNNVAAKLGMTSLLTTEKHSLLYMVSYVNGIQRKNVYAVGYVSDIIDIITEYKKWLVCVTQPT